MDIGVIFIGFLYVLLKCACIILLAFLIVWACRFIGVTIDSDVYKWGRIVVILACIIVVALWAFGLISGIFSGGPPAVPYHSPLLR